MRHRRLGEVDLLSLRYSVGLDPAATSPSKGARAMDSRRNGSEGVEQQLVGADGRSYGLRVHQATGMVAAQVDCQVAAALDLLVEYAAEHECTVDQTASDVIERRVRFDGRAPRRLR